MDWSSFSLGFTAALVLLAAVAWLGYWLFGDLDDEEDE